jgi:hypothetical protein
MLVDDFARLVSKMDASISDSALYSMAKTA